MIAGIIWHCLSYSTWRLMGRKIFIARCVQIVLRHRRHQSVVVRLSFSRHRVYRCWAGSSCLDHGRQRRQRAAERRRSRQRGTRSVWLLREARSASSSRRVGDWRRSRPPHWPSGPAERRRWQQHSSSWPRPAVLCFYTHTAQILCPTTHCGPNNFALFIVPWFLWRFYYLRQRRR